MSSTRVMWPVEMMVMSGRAEVAKISGGMVLGGLSVALIPGRSQ